MTSVKLRHCFFTKPGVDYSYKPTNLVGLSRFGKLPEPVRHRRTKVRVRRTNRGSGRAYCGKSRIKYIKRDFLSEILTHETQNNSIISHKGTSQHNYVSKDCLANHKQWVSSTLAGVRGAWERVRDAGNVQKYPRQQKGHHLRLGRDKGCTRQGKGEKWCCLYAVYTVVYSVVLFTRYYKLQNIGNNGVFYVYCVLLRGKQDKAPKNAQNK